MSVFHLFFRQCDEYDTDSIHVLGPVAAGMKVLVIITVFFFLILLIPLLTCYY